MKHCTQEIEFQLQWWLSYNCNVYETFRADRQSSFCFCEVLSRSIKPKDYSLIDGVLNWLNGLYNIWREFIFYCLFCYIARVYCDCKHKSQSIYGSLVKFTEPWISLSLRCYHGKLNSTVSKIMVLIHGNSICG